MTVVGEAADGDELDSKPPENMFEESDGSIKRQREADPDLITPNRMAKLRSVSSESSLIALSNTFSSLFFFVFVFFFFVLFLFS